MKARRRLTEWAAVAAAATGSTLALQPEGPDPALLAELDADRARLVIESKAAESHARDCTQEISDVRAHCVDRLTMARRRCEEQLSQCEAAGAIK